MKQPVVIEVGARAQRTEPQHGLGSHKRPPRTCPVYLILDQVSARAFDDTVAIGSPSVSAQLAPRDQIPAQNSNCR